MQTIWKKLLIAASLSLAAPTLMAQAWPNKPIKMIVPFPPGGASDSAGRIYARFLSDKLGQQVVVDNRAGAGGEIGAQLAASADPDGYTFLLAALGSHSIHAAMPGQKPQYDFAKAFVGVSMASAVPMVVAVNSNVPAKNIQELIALAKSKPGKLTFGSAGPGTPQQMAGELFKVMTGAQLLHVPYKGSGPAITDLLAGQVDMVFETMPAITAQVPTGKIRLLGATGAKRAASQPTLATLQEQGVAGYNVTTAYAVLAPAGTPAEIVNRVSKEMQALGKTEAVQAAFKAQGAEVVTSTPEETTRLIKEEMAKWADVVKRSADAIK